MEINEEKLYLEKLIDNHWLYVDGILENTGIEYKDKRRLEYHYRTAMAHGWKHCKQYCKSKFGI